MGYGLKPNCGVKVKLEDFENVEMNDNLKEIISTTVDSCKTVYFYLKTSGFGRYEYADVLNT
jgi:hypothetical protein